MAFNQKLWVDAPNPLTPLSAAAMNDLEARIAAAATQADAFNLQPAGRYTNSGALSVANTTLTPVGLDTNTFDSDSQHFTSSANLTGTVAKTNGSAALVGTGTLFTSQLSVGQVIDVPGSAVETRVVTSITDDTHLTVAGNYANTSSGQTAARNNTLVTARTAGVYTIVGGLQWASNATGMRYIAIVRIGVTGTSTIPAAERDVAVSGANHEMNVAVTIKLAQWECVQLNGWQSSGGALNINQSTELTPTLSVVRTAAG
jgi:hypothetical protein